MKKYRLVVAALLSALTVLVSPALPAQAATAPLCSDMLDDDGDGRADYPADPGCSGPDDPSERGSLVCDNGVDDDGDGVADAPLDRGCAGPADSSERTGASCDDGVDNDADGRTDWPVDTACTDVHDQSEGGDCDARVPGVVACPTTGPVLVGELVPLAEVTPGAHYDVVAYVDAYEFVLPGAGTHTIPCVVLASDLGDVNPCAAAGGRFERHALTLVSASPQAFDVDLGETARVRVCHATWRVTVLGFGPEALPGFVLC